MRTKNLSSPLGAAVPDPLATLVTQWGMDPIWKINPLPAANKRGIIFIGLSGGHNSEPADRTKPPSRPFGDFA